MFSLKKLFGKKERYGKTVRSSYLSDHGWYLSLERQKSVTAGMRSAAVLPYSLADLLDKRITHPMTVYVRWGMHTYRWMLHHAHHVSSDHIVMHRMSDHKHGRFERSGDSTPEHIGAYAETHANRFHVMIVDGPGKREDMSYWIPMLAPDGVLVVVDDQLDPFDYDAVASHMTDHGYRKLEFTNPAPLYHELNTILFYKDGNCLGI